MALKYFIASLAIATGDDPEDDSKIDEATTYSPKSFGTAAFCQCLRVLRLKQERQQSTIVSILNRMSLN